MQIINCESIRDEMLIEAKLELTKIYARTGEYPSLTVIQVEGDGASDVYVRNKKRVCDQVGVQFVHIKLPNESDYKIVKDTIQAASSSSTAVMLQLPLPEHLKQYEQELLDITPWKKDVDGLSTISVGKLWNSKDCITPATPTGILRLLPKDLSGKNVCIVGRSNLVGKPLFKLLMDRNATVTMCHSKSYDDFGAYTSNSDIIITAIGKPKFFLNGIACGNRCGDHEPKTIIDVGINRDENGKLCGDVDIEAFVNEDCSITPVPKGVGILTTAQLVLNVIKCYKLQNVVK